MELNLPPEEIKQLVIDVLKTCYDPEIPVDIYELGLVYDISITPPADVKVMMTLTAPSCPVAGSLPGQVEQKLKSTPGISDATVEITWDPPWDRSRMTEAAQLQLGLY